MRERIVCRLAPDQTELVATMVGRIIVMGLEGMDLQGVVCFRLSDATRAAIVQYLELTTGARLNAAKLIRVDNVPIHIDNMCAFGDVFAEEPEWTP